MRIAFLLLLVLSPSLMAELFYVGLVGTRSGDVKGYTREKLIALFDQYNATLAQEGCVRVIGEVIEVQPAGLRCVSGTVDRSEVFFVHTSVEGFHEGAIIAELCLPTEPYSYRTVMGGTSTIKAYRILDSATIKNRLLTRDEFVEQLKAGKIFTVELPDTKVCSQCMGTGKVSGRLDLKQHPDRKYRCRKCGSRGTIQIKEIYSIRWLP